MDTEDKRSQLTETLGKLQFQPLPGAPAPAVPEPRRGLNSSMRMDGQNTAHIPELQVEGQGKPAAKAEPTKEQIMQAALLKAATEIIAQERERIVSRALELIQGD